MRCSHHCPWDLMVFQGDHSRKVVAKCERSVGTVTWKPGEKPRTKEPVIIIWTFKLNLFLGYQ